MATFKDTDGRTWSINLDAPSIMELREDVDPQFLKGPDGAAETIQRLQADPVLLCNVVYVLCREQLGASSQKQFYESVIGDAIDRATEALLGAILSFSPSATRTLLTAIADKNRTLQQLGLQRTLAAINSPTVEAEFLDKIDALLGTSTPLTKPTNSPDMLASTPGA